MKKILIVDDEFDIREIIGFLMSSELGLECDYAGSGKEAIDKIDQLGSKIELIVCDHNMPNGTGGDVYLHLLKNNIKTPFVLLSSDFPEEHEEYKDRKNFFGHIQKPDYSENLVTIANKLKENKLEIPILLDKKEEELKTTYQSIGLYLLLKLKLTPCSLYLKISGEKVIRIMHQGESFEEHDLLKYSAKGINFLYIDVNDKELIIKEIELLINSKEKNEKAPVSFQELLSDVIAHFGINEQIAIFVTEHIDKCYTELVSDKNLNLLIKKTLANKSSYLTTHSILLSIIATSISTQMTWNSEVTIKKLVAASLLHDTTIREKLTLDDEIKDQKYLKKEYLAHPNRNFSPRAGFEFKFTRS